MFAVCLGSTGVARADTQVWQLKPLPRLDAHGVERNRVVRQIGLLLGAAGGVALGAGGLLLRYHENRDPGAISMLAGLAIGSVGFVIGTGAAIRFHRHRIGVGDAPRPTNRRHRWLLVVGWTLLHLGVTTIALTTTQAVVGSGGYVNPAAAIAGITTGAVLILGSALVLFAGYVRRRTARRAKLTFELGAAGTPWSGGLRVQW